MRIMAFLVKKELYEIDSKTGLNEHDMLTIMKTIEDACFKYDVIETDVASITRLLNRIMISSYMHEHNYMQTLKKIIYLYYQIRSNYTWKLSDDMLAECMEKTFSIQLGIVDGRYKENLLDMIGRYFK